MEITRSWRGARRRPGRLRVATVRSGLARAGRELRQARVPLTLAAAIGMTAIAGASFTAQLDLSPLASWLNAGVCGTATALMLWRPWAGWSLAFAGAWGVASASPVSDPDPWLWPIASGITLIFAVVALAITSRSVITIPAAAATAALFAAFSIENTQVGWGVGILLFALGGTLVRWRRHVRAELARSEEASEVERARRAVLEERTRIARELHDVVAHRMSLVVVAAETAPYRLGGVSEPVKAELGAISATAREAMTEMRALLGVLRQSDDATSYIPQGGLADLPALVAGAVRAGLPVRLDAQDDLDDVRPVLQQSAYRIVQESLANAARHAPGAAVVVSVRHTRAGLSVMITNEPPQVEAPQAPNGHPRHGLVGMSERAAAVGGSVRAGPRWDGGYEVLAVLPTTGDPAT